MRKSENNKFIYKHDKYKNENEYFQKKKPTVSSMSEFVLHKVEKINFAFKKGKHKSI